MLNPKHCISPLGGCQKRGESMKDFFSGRKQNRTTYYVEKLCCDRFDYFYFMKQDDDWTDEDGKLDKKNFLTQISSI